jgi:cytochrome c556
MKQFVLLAAALVAIPITAALAQPPAGLTPEQIVAARQTGFAQSRGSFVAMKAAADAGADVKQLYVPARTLGRWARTLPSLFPAGTNLAASHALPTVWSDRAGFEAKAAAYAAAATALAAAAQSGDRAVFLARWSDVAGACSACHDSYRAPD